MAYPDKPELPKGAETHLRNWSKSKLYNRSKEISSKYFTKGNQVEEQAIELLSEYPNYHPCAWLPYPTPLAQVVSESRRLA